MKRLIHVFKHTAAACLGAALAAVPAAAQQPAERGRLRLEPLDRLSALADETVRVELDAALMHLGCGFLSDDDPEEREVKEVCRGLKGVYVRGLKFKAAGQYAEADVRALREQLSGPGWSRVVDITTQSEGLEKAEVYVASEGGRVSGLALLNVEPRQLTIINFVGDVDFDKLRRLGGVLNLPKITIERKKRPAAKP